jgi:hypothetical protein
MDPGGKIYTIDEFRCWKVENLDDERSDENRNKGGVPPTEFPIQLYIYIDNKIIIK